MTPPRLLWVASLLVCATAVQARADADQLLRVFHKPPPRPWAYFGYNVAGLNGCSLVASPREPEGIYCFSNETGALTRTFVNPTGRSASFGISLAASNSLVLVGAESELVDGIDAGAAYLFDANTGNVLRAFTNPTPAANDRFGRSVAFAGSGIVVGAYLDDSTGVDYGSVYLFDSVSGSLLRTLSNPHPMKSYFGVEACGTTDRVLIGAPIDDAAGPEAGAVYIYDKASGSLLHTVKGKLGSRFGCSIATSGQYAIVGAVFDSSLADLAGAAYVVDIESGEIVRTLSNPNPEDGDRYGYSVAAQGGYALVGAIYDHEGSNAGGAAYLFEIAGGSLVATFNNPTPTEYDAFGRSVGFVGDNVLVGAWGEDLEGNDMGAAYLFRGVPEPSVLSVLAITGCVVALRRKRHWS